MDNKGVRFTRRGFLKGAALGAGTLALSDQIMDFQRWARANAEAQNTKVPTFCNGCGNRCGIFAHVKNGRLWKIEGNPEANGNLGFICPRGHGYIMTYTVPSGSKAR